MSQFNNDIDAIETQEWIEALEDVIENDGKDRANFLIDQLINTTAKFGIVNHYPQSKFINFINTIPTALQPKYPGNIKIERKIENLNRWNSTVMVVKANIKDSTLGGHIASGTSILSLYEVGFNHFFQASTAEQAGDLIFYQGHTTPVIYARSYLEGRLTKKQLLSFRQQALNKEGLSSYPHPYLQPDYWQFPTVSMGLGPIQAIYQARFMKYLDARKIINTKKRKIWVFCGDGEMDEPESLGAINRASREGLDNLIFIINCNLQRLDGLVNGNGKIIQEFEGMFIGAGWNVIKILWGSSWDSLFEKDVKGKLKKRLNSINDGELQNAYAHSKENFRKIIFGGDIELESMIKNYSDDDIEDLMRGGHDPIKIFSGYHQAVNNNTGKPTVILAMTIKGYGLGEWGESKNIAHNVKKLSIEALKYMRNRFDIPLNDQQVENMEFIKFKYNSPEYNYLHNQRKYFGGYLPSRFENNQPLSIPDYKDFAKIFLTSSNRKFSTTTAFVRMFVNLTRHKDLKKYLVPITVDESRTFGMEGLFRQLGIYNRYGQKYIPEDKDQVMYYKESFDGQIIQDGINEAGGFCSWLAAATSYSVHLTPMIPFYIYYSMFGFQRIGDLAWVAGDLKAKGFLLGGTSGRTTLNGEGLQHEDGHSHIQANLIPSCISYDPTYAYELGVILWEGMRRMYIEGDQVFYYITLMNENYPHGNMPQGVEKDIIKGMYLLKKENEKNLSNKHVQLMGSGAILREVEAASELLKKDFNITSDIWSITSANELYRDGRKLNRCKLFNKNNKFNQKTHIEKCLEKHKGPVIAASDYIKLNLEQLRDFMPKNYTTLGTDGYGRSDSRCNLRHFFEVDRYHIILAALNALLSEGNIVDTIINKAIDKYKINIHKKDPMYH